MTNEKGTWNNNAYFNSSTTRYMENHSADTARMHSFPASHSYDARREH